MARAYAFCIGKAPYLPEIEFSRAVKEFGVMAVTGRNVLSAREVRDCLTAQSADRFISLFHARKESGMSKWDDAHPFEARLIARVQKEYLQWLP
jgi:hypothetical protein